MENFRVALGIVSKKAWKQYLDGEVNRECYRVPHKLDMES